MYVALSFALAACAEVGFNYGLFRLLKKNDALYIRMIVFSVGCAMLGRIFEALQFLVNGQIRSGFHVGLLGIIGSFMFLFSANFGQMDSLVDDGSKAFKKARIIALAAPAVVIAMWCVIPATNGFSGTTIPYAVVSLFIAQAAYFHLKHIIIKDVDFGLIRAIRPYNIVALIYAFLCMVEMTVKTFNLPAVCIIIVYILQCAVMLALMPVLERGVNKWTI